MKYKAGQSINMKDGCSLNIYKVDLEENSIDAVLIIPSKPHSEFDPYIDVPESTIDSIISRHNWR